MAPPPPAATAAAAAAAAAVPAAAAGGAAASEHGGGLPRWAPTPRVADRRLLMARDEPILFFAEVPLYESELDDNGVSQLVVKVRVMPRCWLVLLRFWLRVDGTLVRLRETRLFCRRAAAAWRGLPRPPQHAVYAAPRHSVTHLPPPRPPPAPPARYDRAGEAGTVLREVEAL